MKLFTKEVDKQLFAQYPKGSSLENQMVVAKIFNPYGRGVWYLLNSDPEDPDYIWAIVDLFEPEMGSVSRSELQTVKVPPFGLGLERDIYFTPKPAKEVFEGVLSGKRYAAGGMTPGRYYKDNSGNELRYVGESQGKLLFKDGEKIVYKSEEDFEDRPKETKLFGFFEKGGEIAQENNEMLQSNIVELKHHADELDKIVTNKTEVEPWVIAKTERASTDLSDVTHYLDGEKKKGLKMPFEKGGYMAKGGKISYEGKEGKIVSKKGDMYFVEIEKYHPNGDTLRTVLREGEFKKMADGGMLPNGKYKYEKGDEGMFQGDEVRVVKYHNGDRTYEYNIIDEDGKVKTHGVAKAEKFENQFRYFPKMAHGGETKGKRYKVNVYYGGEMEDEEFYTDSLDEAERASQGGEHSEIYDNHKKEFVEIEYAKGGTTESYEVELSAESNPDYDKSSYEGSVNIKSHKVKAKSIEEAREIVVAFIMENDLGSGNWSGGNVYKNGKKIGHVSYNGRYWDDTKMAKGGQMKQNYIIKLLDALRLAMKRSEGNRWYTHGTIVSLKGYDKMSLNYLIPNDYPISNEYRVGLEAKLSYKKDNVQYNYEFSTKNKEKSENIDNARKITWIYMPLTQDVAKQIYNQLEKQGDIKELETWSMENSYAKGGKLVGKQKNLDVNKNGKLDSEDFKMLRGEKMAMGGKVKFEDKVKAIKESLLKRKKVSPKVQKDYGKTYSPKEAEESAKRIAASQRLKYELKKK